MKIEPIGIIIVETLAQVSQESSMDITSSEESLMLFFHPLLRALSDINSTFPSLSNSNLFQIQSQVKLL